MNLAGGESSLGGGKKGGIAGGRVSSVVAGSASGILDVHVPVCSLEVMLEFLWMGQTGTIRGKRGRSGLFWLRCHRPSGEWLASWAHRSLRLQMTLQPRFGRKAIRWMWVGATGPSSWSRFHRAAAP
jgi:hypothetical protein